jgi:Trp operon repressor
MKNSAIANLVGWLEQSETQQITNYVNIIHHLIHPASMQRQIMNYNIWFSLM